MIVYDKNTFGSNREIDEVNGYLRVDECNISKCQVRPYLGREIPNWREFDLEPDKIYNVYCPREELKKAAPTFNNLPLTREHIEVDVDNVPKEKIVGSLGDHASFEYPYLKNNLIIYDKKDIDLVMSGKKKELSCGYRYTPVRQSGEADGQHYDFVMTDIVGNHVALVKQGRAGRDVMVADSSKGILEVIKEKIMAVFDNDLVGDKFKESEHPRAKNGQFTSAGGAGSSGSEKKDYEEKTQSFEDFYKDFEKREDNNDHSGNAVALAKRYGDEKDVKEAEEILKLHDERMELTPDLYKRRRVLEEKFIPMMSKEGESSDLTEDKASDKIEEKELPVEAGKPEAAGEEKATKEGETEMTEEVKEVEKEEEKKPETPAKVEKDEKPAEVEKKEEKSDSKEESAEKADEKKEEAEKVEEKAEEEEIVEDKSEEAKKEEKKEEQAEDKCGSKMAKDEAMVMDADAIRAEAKAEVIADFKARETARRAVRKMVGDVDVFAFDSAEEIYKFACEKAGMDLNEVVSFKDAFKGLSLNKSKLAMDASPVSGSDVECFKDIRLT